MAQTLNLLAPHPLAECIRRLEGWQALPMQRVRRGNALTGLRVSRLVVGPPDDLPPGAFSFELVVRCSNLTYPPTFGGPVFVAVEGALIPQGKATRVRALVRPGWPTTGREWLARLGWYLALAPFFGTMLVAALRLGELGLWQLAGSFALGMAALYARDYVLYGQGMAAVERALKQTFGF